MMWVLSESGSYINLAHASEIFKSPHGSRWVVGVRIIGHTHDEFLNERFVSKKVIQKHIEDLVESLNSKQQLQNH